MATFTCEVPLRWVDLDAQGHVNNAVVLDYLQEARVQFLLRGPNAHLLGRAAIVVGHRVQYLRPVQFSPDPISVELRVTDVRAGQWTLAYDMTQAGRPVARATTRMAVFDFEHGVPRRLSAGERAWFAEVAEASEPWPDLGTWALGERPHRHVLQVRWSDLDAYGHVNNVHFFDYVAEARIRMNTALFEAASPGQDPSTARVMWVVARQDLTYRSQLAHRLEPYEVATSIARVGTTSLTLVAAIRDPLADPVRDIARSLTVLVCTDPAGRPVPIPDALRAGAAQWPAYDSSAT